MGYIKRTGGSKEFHYSKEDFQRISKEDTKSTKEFKKSYKKWFKEQKNNKSRYYTNKKNYKRNKHKKHIASKTHSYKKIEKSEPKINSKKEKSNFHKKHKVNPWKKILIVFFIILLLISIGGFYLYKEITIVESEEFFKEVTKTKNVVYYEDISNDISFEEYLTNLDEYDGREIETKAFLRRHFEGNDLSGVWIQSIVDDNGDVFIFQKTNLEFKPLFPDNGTSEEVYLIVGILDKNYKSFEIIPSAITLSERGVKSRKEVEREIIYKENISFSMNRTKHPFLKSILFKVLGKEIVCDDGTFYSKCSKNKPYYCKYVGLVENAEECGCPIGEREHKGDCIVEIKCSDGTYHPECSKDNFQCLNGKLVMDAKECGCPEGYKKRYDECKKTCDDGTFYEECSKDKPKYCDDGELIDKASECGCPYEEVKENERCVSQYLTGKKKINMRYTLRGKEGNIELEVYGGLNDYLSEIPRSISYSYVPPTNKDFIMREINEKEQEEELNKLVELIKKENSNEEDQVRVAVSLIQSIPYDWDGFVTGDLNGRYAYEVLYDQKGVCGEKSRILVIILRELGYGVATFEFNDHEAVGIKCPSQYDYQDSGYCFIETARPTIMTDSENEYVGAGKLYYPNEIVIISEGKSFEDIGEEYEDAGDFIEIREYGGGIVPTHIYNKWVYLVNKYGLEVDE